MHTLTSSFQLQTGHTQKNRTVLAPMTNSQSHDDGTLSDAELHWLALRAEGGFGMIISAASHVQPNAKAWAGQMGCFSDTHIDGLAKLAAIGNNNGALTILQLFHGGVRSPRDVTGEQPTAPSAVTLDFPGFETPRALEEGEIEETIQNFVAAAQRAHAAGLSGVEVHGANGYLFTQFLSTQTNLRTDQWGGSLENRARFLIKTVQEIKKAVPPDFIVGVRLLPEDAPAQKGFDIDETTQVIEWLVQLDVDYVHISSPDVTATTWKYANSQETNLHRFRKVVPAHIALIACGGVKVASDVEFALGEGADLVAIGKTAINTPDWPLRAVEPGFMPKPFPMTEAEADAAGIAPPFMAMLRAYHLVAPAAADDQAAAASAQ
jgi:2,4-dienoyl-CoA reductase-like NADH-dependent reductase (Old Yellow Enzyme family)